MLETPPTKLRPGGQAILHLDPTRFDLVHLNRILELGGVAGFAGQAAKMFCKMTNKHLCCYYFYYECLLRALWSKTKENLTNIRSQDG